MTTTGEIRPEFVQRFTAAQSALYAFVSGLMGGVVETQDVLQEANKAIWRRAAEYDASRPFLPWAYSLAHWQVRAWRTSQKRSRLVLDDDLLSRVAAHFEEEVETAEQELQALEKCLAHLPPRQRELVDERYSQGETVRAMAARRGQPENALAALLYRIRKALGDCITASLAREERA